MMENPKIIRMNIAHYQAALVRDMGDEKRSVVERLLVEAKENLAPAMIGG